MLTNATLPLNSLCSATAGEIRAWCREQMGRHEIPRKVRFLPDLPKTASGKILKRELRRGGEVERGIDAEG